jgi:hypothetical protein
MAFPSSNFLLQLFAGLMPPLVPQIGPRSAMESAVKPPIPAGQTAAGGEPMPAGSSKKRERQYEHVKDSYQDRGVSKDEAEERAARTVNKQRRKSGETKKK